MRLISLKRRGPLPSSMMTNTLHLSPTRANIEATLDNRSRGGRWAVRTGTLVCSGFKECAFLRGVGGSHSYSLSYKHIPRVNTYETSAYDSSVLGPHSRQPSGFRRDRGSPAPGYAQVLEIGLSRPGIRLRWHISTFTSRRREGAVPEAACNKTRNRPSHADEFLPPTSSCSARPCIISPFQASSRPGSTDRGGGKNL